MTTVSKTIRLSNTVDHWSRRVHVNVRNGKTTMVYRWKDTSSKKNHTQRMTLSTKQTRLLISALSSALVHAVLANGSVDQLDELLMSE